MTCIGQRRSGRSMVGKARYFWIGIAGIENLLVRGSPPMRWLIKRNRELSGQRASAPPTAPKSQMEKSPSVGQGGAVNSESFVQMDRRHQHYQEQGVPKIGNGNDQGSASVRTPSK